MRSFWNRFLCWIGIHEIDGKEWYVPYYEIEDDPSFSFIEYEVNYCKRCDARKERYKTYDKSRNAKADNGRSI